MIQHVKTTTCANGCLQRKVCCGGKVGAIEEFLGIERCGMPAPLGPQ